MAPKRPKMPSWDELSRKAAEHASQWAQEFLAEPPRDAQGNEIARDSSSTRRGEPVKAMDPTLWWEMEMADNEGDSTHLLPYQPTPSIFPPRPRTRAAGYNKETQELRIEFRDGSRYVYHDVPPNVWRNFTRVKSPGRFVNRVLNHYSYERETDAKYDDSAYDRFRRQDYRDRYADRNGKRKLPKR